MKTMPISQFKTHALKIVSEVAQNNDIIVITKRGVPLAQITSYQIPKSLHEPAQLADTLVFEEDILSPLGETLWEACK